MRDDGSEEVGGPGVTRRAALGRAAGIASTFVLPDHATAEAAVPAPRAATDTIDIVPVVNGRATPVSVDPRTSLLDLLRERLGLTGAKKGCDHGQCGACTVHVNGKRIASCLTLAVKTDRRAVTTIEGLATKDSGGGDRLHPMQQAFIDHDALQCGYCTPGQIMAAVACVREGNTADRATIREFMSGNICRCGAYVGIVAAIEDVAKTGRRV